MRLAACFLVLASSPALSQSLNLRLTEMGPGPSPSYGAAIGQSGAWNTVPIDFGTGASTQCVDLQGQLTSAFASTTGCDGTFCDFPGFGSDVGALYAGTLNSDCHFVSPTHISGMADGHYVATVYGSSCFPSERNVIGRLTDDSYSATDTTSGAYDGSFDAVKLARFEFDLAATSLRIDSFGYGSMSAVQITQVAPLAIYCSSKVNSQGCAGKITVNQGSHASVSDATPFEVGAIDIVTNTSGLFFYGFGRDVKPFKGGFHCVQAPTPRTPVQFSGGTPGVNCSGSFALDFNAYLQTPVASNVEPGMVLNGQYWYRDPNDPAGFDSATTDALEFGVAP